MSNALEKMIHGQRLKTTRKRPHSIDVNNILERQKGWCANNGCAKLNRVKQRVNAYGELDHKISLAIWKIKGNKGNPNSLSNSQLLCPKCHRAKSAKDSKKLAELKRKKKTNTPGLVAQSLVYKGPLTY